jgi:chemotaxis protein histidine kinase CheA
LGGTVEISAGEMGEQVVITVCDQGDGDDEKRPEKTAVAPQPS